MHVLHAVHELSRACITACVHACMHTYIKGKDAFLRGKKAETHYRWLRTESL